MEVTDSEKSRIRSMLSHDTLVQVKELKKQQLRCFYQIMKWALLSPFGSSPGFILEGYAGTGKTFLTKVLSSALSKVVLTATTNKAVKEIKKAAPSKDAMTIYSLLGLRMEQHEDELRLTSGGKSQAINYRFVFLDEAGMVPKVLIPYIERAMRMGVRFLMIGDRKQVPPVGERLSDIWDSYPTVKLTKVLRHDNQILALATQVRTTKLSKVKWRTDKAKNEGVWCLSGDSFYRKIKLYAERGFFNDNRAKAIAWRNVTVDELNHAIRLAIFKEKIYDSKYLVGDRIVFTSPYTISKYQQCYVDDEGEILEVQVAPHATTGFKCYFLTVKLDIGKHIIKVIHEDSEEAFQSMLTDLSNIARASRKREDWAKFWGLKESVAYIKYSYALTVHRAQGSTYLYAFVSISDILRNSNRGEAKKCAYTSLTRPTTRLMLN